MSILKHFKLKTEDKLEWDLPELWASLGVKNLGQPEIDFLQGRVSASVFMQNYFNPLWISNLKARAIENVNILLKATK